jgi:hypothetical protein
MGLGRWAEGVQELKIASSHLEDGEPNVSHVINLALAYCDLQRPQEALDTIAKVSDRQSPYGRMQVEFVKLEAALQKNDHAALSVALEFMAKHRSDAPVTYQAALVVANRAEEVAEVFISRLQDPATRFDALVEAQEYLEPRIPPFVQETRDRWRSILKRHDVHAAIAKVGNIQKYAIAPPLS